MRIPILRFSTIVTCLVLCSAPYQVQATSNGFLFDNNTFTTIDVPGAEVTQATGINNAGQIVGSYSAVFHNSETGDHGFLYSGGSFTTIRFPGPWQTFANGINTGGQIVGTYDPIPTVPEPSTLLLLGVALVGLAARVL